MKRKIIILTVAILLFKIGFSQNYKVEIKTSFWSDTLTRPEIKPIIEVYKNYTQIISHRYLQGLLIYNPDIAKAIKQIFNLVWESIKK